MCSSSEICTRKHSANTGIVGKTMWVVTFKKLLFGSKLSNLRCQSCSLTDWIMLKTIFSHFQIALPSVIMQHWRVRVHCDEWTQTTRLKGCCLSRLFRTFSLEVMSKALGKKALYLLTKIIYKQTKWIKYVGFNKYTSGIGIKVFIKEQLPLYRNRLDGSEVIPPCSRWTRCVQHDPPLLD